MQNCDHVDVHIYKSGAKCSSNEYIWHGFTVKQPLKSAIVKLHKRHKHNFRGFESVLVRGCLQFALTPSAARALRWTKPATLVVQNLSAILPTAHQWHDQTAAPPIGTALVFKLL